MTTFGPLRWLRDRLVEPRLAGLDLDGDDRVTLHRQILLGKPMFQQVVREFYELCVDLDRVHFSGAGIRVELGAGPSLFKRFFPDIVSTDVKAGPDVDRIVDAQDMPFKDESVRAFYAIDCFHHFPRPERFFTELERTLVPGGGCVLLEPYHGPVARLLYRRLFDSESFDPDQIGWNVPASRPMCGANQALSFVVFTRDRDTFQARHPTLNILREFALDSYLRYLTSGGLNFRPLVPAYAAPALRLCERALRPAVRVLALHHVIVLRKEPATKDERPAPAASRKS